MFNKKGKSFVVLENFPTFADEKCDIVTKKVRTMIIKRDRYLNQIIAKKGDGMII